jgi:hypothetical protein
MYKLFTSYAISGKKDGKFLWQCFKCGKKIFVSENIDDSIEESWSPPR